MRGNAEFLAVAQGQGNAEFLAVAQGQGNAEFLAVAQGQGNAEFLAVDLGTLKMCGINLVASGIGPYYFVRLVGYGRSLEGFGPGIYFIRWSCHHPGNVCSH